MFTISFHVLLGVTIFSWQNIADKILCNEICMTKYPVSSAVGRVGIRESGYPGSVPTSHTDSIHDPGANRLGWNLQGG